jgi:hypothetical protein
LRVRAVVLFVLAATAVACTSITNPQPAPTVACALAPDECDRVVGVALDLLKRGDLLVGAPVSVAVGDECAPGQECPAPSARSWIVAVREVNGRVHGVRVYPAGAGDPDLLGEVPPHILALLR